MKTLYMTALSPLSLEKVLANWGPSPLPGLLPLSFFDHSFPRDRVDLQVLAGMLPLSLKGPEREGAFLILEPECTGNFPCAHTRDVPGSKRPEAMAPSLLPFSMRKGMILGLCDAKDFPPLNIKFSACFVGLYRLRMNPQRAWWEDFGFEELWKLRVPRSGVGRKCG